MAVTYDSNYAGYNVNYLANRVVASLSRDTLISSLMVGASNFADFNGSYRPGASIIINSIDNASTSYVTSVTTNSALSSSKPTTTQYTLDLDTVAVTQLDYDVIERTFSNNWQTAIDSHVRKYTADHLGAIEQRVFLETFNVSGINANRLGNTAVANSALTFDDLAVINQKFSEANAPRNMRRYLVLPPKMYMELLKDSSNEFQLMEDSTMLRNAAISPKYNMVIYESNNTPAISQMSNITVGSVTTTNKVGFAFMEDSIALFNPDLSLGVDAVGIREQVIREGGFSTTVSVSANNDLNVPEARYVMRSLFGSIIYRPSVVFPILNGTIV